MSFNDTAVFRSESFVSRDHARHLELEFDSPCSARVSAEYFEGGPNYGFFINEADFIPVRRGELTEDIFAASGEATDLRGVGRVLRGGGRGSVPGRQNLPVYRIRLPDYTVGPKSRIPVDSDTAGVARKYCRTKCCARQPHPFDLSGPLRQIVSVQAGAVALTSAPSCLD